MTAAVGLYVPGHSWLYRLDPRAKLWFSLLGVALCLMGGKLAILAGVLAAAHLVLLVGGLSPGQIARLWRGLAPLALIILVLQPILMTGSGPAILQLGPLQITEVGLLTGVRYALRVVTAAFVVLVPVLTTPVNTLVRGLQKVGLPYIWGMTIGLALRYLGTIGALYATISEAQQARGWDVSQGGLIGRARAAVPTLIAVIIASLRLADSLALAMAARGFGVRPQGGRRTWRNDIAMKPADWAMLAITTLGFVGTLLIAR